MDASDQAAEIYEEQGIRGQNLMSVLMSELELAAYKGRLEGLADWAIVQALETTIKKFEVVQ